MQRLIFINHDSCVISGMLCYLMCYILCNKRQIDNVSAVLTLC